MTSRFGAPIKLLLGAAVFTVVFGADPGFSPTDGLSLVSPADARVGRPLTPVSYAGVARRTTYRAVARPAYPVVVAPVPVVVVQPTCVDTVDAYGRVTRVCR